MRSALFVVNPLGTHRLDTLGRHCEEAGARYGWRTEMVVTEEGDTSRGLHRRVREFLEPGAPRAWPGAEGIKREDRPGVTAAEEKLVFAVGGDGTVRACAHDLAGTGVPLAVVPRGTANLFAHALGVPAGIAASLRNGFTGDTRLVDVAFAGDAPFVAMAGIGIDAAVVATAARYPKHAFGWPGYALAALPHLPGRAVEVEVSVDGAPPLAFQARSVVVGNVGILPGGFTVLPGAEPDDGILEVGVLSPEGIWGWVELARRFVAGRQRPGFTHLRGATVSVRVTLGSWPLQLDGEALGTASELRVEVRKRVLLLKVPRALREDRAPGEE